MSGGGSGGGSQTVSNEPWDGAKDYLTQLFSQAQNLYNTTDATPFQSLTPAQRQQQATQLWGMTPDQVSKLYGGGNGIQTGINTGVMPLTADQIASQNMLRGIAGQSLSPLYSQAGSTVLSIANNPLGGAGASAINTGRSISGNPLSDYDSLAKNLYKSVANNAGGVYADDAGSYLRSAAGGKYVGQQNPYLADMFNAASRPVIESFQTQALPALTAQFAASGRYGSGAQQQVQGQAAEDLQRTLGDMSSNLYGNAYAQERQLQQQAAGTLGNLGLSQDQLRQASAAGLVNTGQAADQSRLAAAGLLGNLGQAGSQIGLQAAGMMPGIAGAQTQAQAYQAGLLGQVGGQNQQLGQQVLGNLGGMYGGQYQAPWQNLQNYSNIVTSNPAAGLNQQQQQGGGGFSGSGALGGGIAGGVGGAMLPASLGLGPWGIAGGALAGGLLGGWF